MASTPIRVTIEDPETGDRETVELMDDYLIIQAGTCFVSGTQVYANGTHVITVKGRNSAFPRARAPKLPDLD